jgi:hypothetical protein
MVAMTVPDENKVGGRDAREGGRSPHGVVVDREPLPLQDEGGMIDRMNQNIAGIGGQKIAREG